MSDSPTKIERVSRQIIDSKLLAALDDSEVVAALLTKTDLDVVIEALENYAKEYWIETKFGHKADRANRMAEDLEKLRHAAFPPK